MLRWGCCIVMRLSRRSALTGLLLASCSVLLPSCTPADLVDALVPSSGYRLSPDLPYAAGPHHTMDVYQPVDATGPAPVIVFLYGGGWRDGDKKIYRFLGQALASRGYVVAIPDYRQFPEVKFPAFLEDNVAAVAWVHAHVAEYGGDPAKLFLMGHSAGAYNAAMLAVDAQWLGKVGLDPGRDLRGFIGLSGPYAFLPFDETTGPVFGDWPDPQATQPVDQIHAGASGRLPPMLLANGLSDTTVRPVNAVRLSDAVRAKGGSVETKLYPGVDHIDMIGGFASPLHSLAPSLSDTLDFLVAHR